MNKKAASFFASVATAFAIAMLISAFAIFAPTGRLDAIVYDNWMRFKGVTPVNPTPVIIEIDEKSLAKYGQWPWPRHILGAIVQRILDSGALAIGLDILLAEEDRTSPAYLDKQYHLRFGRNLHLEELPEEFRDNDRYLRDKIKDRPVILGAFATYADGELPENLPRATGLAERTPKGAPQPRDTVTRTEGLLTPLPLLEEAAPVGIINATVNDDGVVRSIPLLVRAGDNIYAALSVRTLMAALGKKTLRLDSDQDGLASLQIGGIKVLVERNGQFRPVYHGPARTYPYVSAADVLDGSIDFKNRIVFIGSSATGLLDMRATPFDPFMPGVEVHATIVDNILSGQHVLVPYWTPGLQIVTIFFATGIAVAIFGLLPLCGYLTLVSGMIAGSLWGSWKLFVNGMFVSPVYVILAILLAGAVIIPARFWREQKAKRKIRQAFSRYVSPEIVSRVADDKPLSGERKEITVLFTDVRNFTTISGGMEPEDVVRLLNRYFTPMTACVTSRQGTLDKFEGDALMAFWNAPLDVEGHQQKAVEAAIDMQEQLARLRPDFERDFKTKSGDGVKLYMGVGINCGEVHVGNMGSSDLLDYTCIGNDVNLASRLEGMCKVYGVGIVVSASVKNACRGICFRHLDKVKVKGSDQALDIFTPVLDVNDEIEKLWQDALTTYFQGNFQDAWDKFACLAESKTVRAASIALAEHCQYWLERPPAKWDGVWAYDTK